METRLEIRLQSHDMANPKRMQEAYDLIGGPRPSERDRSAEKARHGEKVALNGFSLEEMKLFSKIKANVFTLDEAKDAVAVIKRRRDELHYDADTLDVFTDAKVQKVWADGVKASAILASRMAEDFLRNLLMDLEDMVS